MEERDSVRERDMYIVCQRERVWKSEREKQLLTQAASRRVLIHKSLTKFNIWTVIVAKRTKLTN